jgi:hypothetical protein
MSAEEWRPVPGFPAYRVSSLGRISSTKYGTERLLRRPPDCNGYRRVTLYGDAGRSKRSVHRVVAEAFHGPCPVAGYEVRHLNGDSLDCRAVNLRWGSRAENVRDAVEHGTHQWAKQTHCKNGHPFDEANTIRNPSQRVCRICKRARQRAWCARQKQVA